MKKYKEMFSSTHTVYRLTTSSFDIKNFVAGICKTFKTALNADKVIVVCKYVNSHPFIKAKFENNRIDVTKGSISILSRREKEILNQEKAIFTGNRMVHMFIFSETLGAVYVKRNPGKGRFGDIEKRWFLSLCETSTMGLKIFQLYNEEHKTVINSIKALNNMLKQYDSTSYLHTKTVSKLIKVLGKELKLTQAELRSLEYASMLHDAGAIQLPTNLLTKHNLTHDEYKVIMKHPREGVELIKNLEFLKPAIPIILHHHERYDGTGYPAKLKREQIPLGARVLTVLDAFDAMYFGRPYKKKKDLLTIIEELKKERSKQFDPKIIDTFLKILQRKNIRKYLKTCL